MGYSRFARRYSGNRNCFLFLRVLRCFTSPRSLPTPYFIQVRVTAHDCGWVSPFGHPRITARLPAPQGLSQAPTSFIGSRCQGIHHVPMNACHTNTQHTTQTTSQNLNHDPSRPINQRCLQQTPPTTLNQPPQRQPPARAVSHRNTTFHPHPHPQPKRAERVHRAGRCSRPLSTYQETNHPHTRRC